MKLYHFAGSPYGWMARIALAEKGLEYEAVEPRDRDTNPELRNLNPINRTPTLVDGGAAIFESLAVLEYLDEKYPRPPLMPQDPAARGRARSMMMLSYLYVQQESRAVHMLLFDFEKWDRRTMAYPPRRPADQVDRKAAQAAEEKLAGHLRILDRELASRAWITGESFGLADIVHTPHAAMFRLRGGPIGEYPHVARWLDACLARPSVRDTATPVVKKGEPI